MLCVVALNYAAFRAELFEDEYEQYVPVSSAFGSFNVPSLTWETFDKNNAPEAFVFDAHICIEPLTIAVPQALPRNISCLPVDIIRDKSPPSPLF